MPEATCIYDLFDEVLSLVEGKEEKHQIENERTACLELLCRALCPGNAAAILWLFDPYPSPGLFRLSSIFVSDQEVSVPERMHKLTAEPDIGVLRSGQEIYQNTFKLSGALGVSFAKQSTVREWAKENGVPNLAFIHVLTDQFAGMNAKLEVPLRTNAASRERGLIGIVQIFSDTPYHSLSRDLDLRKGKWISRVLGNKITLSRNRRRMPALGHLHTLFDHSSDEIRLFRDAAKVIDDCISYEALSVFKNQDNLGLSPAFISTDGNTSGVSSIVAGNSSIPQICYDTGRTIRICDLDNKKECERMLFGNSWNKKSLCSLYSGLSIPTFGSFIATPILISYGYNKRCYGVICLFNKQWGFNKYFSETDQSILEAFSKFLARRLMEIEERRAIRSIFRVSTKGRLSNNETRKSLFGALSDFIPGISVASLCLGKGVISPFGIEKYAGSIFDSHYKCPAPECSGDLDDSIVELPESRRFLHCKKIRDGKGKRKPGTFLVCVMDRNWLAEHEKRVISYASTELERLMLIDDSFDAASDRLVQARHNIRSGLAGLIGHLQTCREAYDRYIESPDPAVRDLSLIQFRNSLKYADYFAGRTRSLMDISRLLEDMSIIKSDKLDVGAHDLRKFLWEMQILFDVEASRRGIKIKNISTKVVMGKECKASYDGNLFFIAVFNIFDNAIKYSYREKDVLWSLARRPGGFNIKIINKGVHISGEDLETIFQPHERIPTHNKETTRPGTGVGLAIAKKIVEAHGGKIDVTSKLMDDTDEEVLSTKYGYTTFTIRLPAKTGGKNDDLGDKDTSF